jgi:hypothetical protein
MAFIPLLMLPLVNAQNLTLQNVTLGALFDNHFKKCVATGRTF